MQYQLSILTQDSGGEGGRRHLAGVTGSPGGGSSVHQLGTNQQAGQTASAHWEESYLLLGQVGKTDNYLYHPELHENCASTGLRPFYFMCMAS